MNALEQLTRVFDDPVVASEIIESLFGDEVEIDARSVAPLARGYTGARLAKVMLANRSGNPKPRWCVIKFCPAVPASHRREGELHRQALNESPREFREQHLTEIVFPAIRCTGGILVIGQSMVDGDPLGTVEISQLAGACEVVWKEILENWAGCDYGSGHSTVAELLQCELGSSFEPGGWLRGWAERHNLLAPAYLQLPDEEAALPNPWRLFAEDSPVAQAPIHYLVGRTHGDLHGDNVLVPVRNGIVCPTAFRLIDLATYDSRGPLSRDLATLLLSLCSREIGASSEHSQNVFLAYLERGHRDERLDGGMPGDVRSVIDSLREPALGFVHRNSWDPALWQRQLKVSLLAQAMLHSAYTSGTPAAARWCSRLAGRLTRCLLGPADFGAGPTMPFDAGKIVETSRMTATRTMGRSARSGSLFVDRTGQRSRLRAALEDQVTSVMVVTGPPGIGKTALVREVLADLGYDDLDVDTSPVSWHEATPHEEVGVPTLIEAIEPPGSGQVAGPSALARLEIALDGLEQAGGIRPIIVLDSAENLLKEGHLLRDPQLDLALDVVQSRPYPLVKVVLLTQHPPEATTGVVWAGSACRISLEGLEPPSLGEYFAQLDPDKRYGLADLGGVDLRRLHGLLAGNPRRAELLHACLSSEPPALQAHEVGPWLSTMQASEVHQRLVRLFVDHLPVEQQRVAEAVAALGVPVHRDTIINVLKPYVSATQVEPALRALVAARLVLERRDGRKHLRKAETEAILGRLGPGDRCAEEGEPPTRFDLLLQAARVLATMQKDDEDVHGIADLDMHFARIDVWLRAGMYGVAHDLIHSMDHLVYLWGSGAELRAQREAIRGRLHDDREGEMMNLAALGDIYSYSGDCPSALTSYKDALSIAQEEQDREAIRRCHLGMGSMFWEHDDLAKAEEHYGWAYALAGEDEDDGGDRAAALIGLADCRQRRGDYRRAVRNALEAFSAVRETEPGLASSATLRLARWYAELNQIPDAQQMLNECANLILAHPDPTAQAELLNSTADLHLYRDLHSEARATAQQAVDVARDHRDPINLRRSLTTLALAHVHLDALPEARKAIEEAARYRVAGRETAELALRGIVAYRCNLPGTARDLFQQLHEETGKRTGADENDLVAWDFTGIALCYSVLLGAAETTTALEAFRRARPERAEPTPGLDVRLRFMVKAMAHGTSDLEPVLSGLACIRPGATV
ncbi:tetratricopeptide repeat protein [Nonomuraea sp. NPDC050540]|uniref:tetratricopeptide repeat protein n=1 Tax=Nonomuraea sp. NPDC050540 TaxID=3364367 RepID=UPI0037B9D23A